MGRLVWLFLLIGILQGWAKAQSRAEGVLSGETHTDISSSLMLPSIPQPRTPPPASAVSPPQLFQCNAKVTLGSCRQQMRVLKGLLDKYGATQLGQWKWVLVSSAQWEMVLAENGLSPNIPAFTVLETRVTFFDDALVSGSSKRLSQLMDAWYMSRGGLLDLAVRHELGHALCQDENESHADHVANLLEQKKPPVCWTPSRRPTK